MSIVKYALVEDAPSMCVGEVVKSAPQALVIIAKQLGNTSKKLKKIKNL